MIKLIYRVCTACLGKGVTEARTLPTSSTSITKASTIKCEACDGVGAIPTGHFFFDEIPDKRDIPTQLEDYSDGIKDYIMSRIK